MGRQQDWCKLSHCYFWRAVFGSVLSPERSTQKEAIAYMSYTEAIAEVLLQTLP